MHEFVVQRLHAFSLGGKIMIMGLMSFASGEAWKDENSELILE